jgi:hypothetical protein
MCAIYLLYISYISYIYNSLLFLYYINTFLSTNINKSKINKNWEQVGVIIFSIHIFDISAMYGWFVLFTWRFNEWHKMMQESLINF